MERFFQALQNLTKQEFLTLFVWKVRPYKGNPHGVGFGLKEGTKVELQRFFVPDGINSVGDYNSRWVGVVVVVVVVCRHFFKTFTMGFLLNALS